jgi:hypothetical protein
LLCVSSLSSYETTLSIFMLHARLVNAKRGSNSWKVVMLAMAER